MEVVTTFARRWIGVLCRPAVAQLCLRYSRAIPFVEGVESVIQEKRRQLRFLLDATTITTSILEMSGQIFYCHVPA